MKNLMDSINLAIEKIYAGLEKKGVNIKVMLKVTSTRKSFSATLLPFMYTDLVI